MKLSEGEILRFQFKLQGLVNSRIVITKHFILRLGERTMDLQEFAELMAVARDILNEKMCVIAYQSVLNNGVTRVTLGGGLKMVCYCDVEAIKLIVKTVY